MESSYNVLLFSSDAEASKDLIEALEAIGCKIVRGRAKQSAVRALKLHGFDALIFDLDAGSLQPLSDIKEAKALHPHLEIIALASVYDAQKALQAVKAGVREFLWKPVHREQAWLVLSKVRERWELKKRAYEAEFYRNLANTDALTALYNYRYFHRQLDVEVARCARLKRSVGLLMLDIDDFKDYNDLYGHLKGDQALKKLANLLVCSSRSYDTVARYGGEEFAIQAPESDKADAKILSLRLKNKVEKLDFEGEDKLPGGNLTVSVGVASFSEDATSKNELIERADEALYMAKRRGKNQVAVWGEQK